ASTQPTGGFNQISINDSHGDEAISIHAQHNMTTQIENNEGHEARKRDTTIWTDDKLAVGGNLQIGVDGSNSIKVKNVYSVNAKYITLTASDLITVHCGGSRITLVPDGIEITSNGAIRINGKPVYINC